MLKPEADDMGKYLQMTDIIDFGHDLVRRRRKSWEQM